MDSDKSKEKIDTISEEELEEFKQKIYSKTYKYQKKPYLVVLNLYTAITIVICSIAILWYIYWR